jgi:hypothetical protein
MSFHWIVPQPPGPYQRKKKEPTGRVGSNGADKELSVLWEEKLFSVGKNGHVILLAAASTLTATHTLPLHNIHAGLPGASQTSLFRRAVNYNRLNHLCAFWGNPKYFFRAAVFSQTVATGPFCRC